MKLMWYTYYICSDSFYRECEEVEQWISEKELVAANEELGKDLEHVEVLQKRFADFVHSVLASEDRVMHVNTLADTLVETNHTGELVDNVAGFVAGGRTGGDSPPPSLPFPPPPHTHTHTHTHPSSPWDIFALPHGFAFAPRF